MYAVKTPALVKALYSDFIWNLNRKENSVYLTFDDGPHPQITLEVLNLLAEANAKGTFFCVGANIEKYPETYNRVLAEGHSVGNHTYDHMNGWKNSNAAYYRSILKCKNYTNSKLFRPPHGKITRTQAKAVKKKFDIVMWDVLSADFDKSVPKEKCFENVVRNIKPGSIVIFHDSEKSSEKMLYTLPKVLAFIAEKNWNLKAIPM
jgi:peptidoglycan/xylan/chitin deacetylase (PgdA/CDA1 family)